MQDLPAVSAVALLDVFGESDCGVTIDRDIWRRVSVWVHLKHTIPTYGCRPRPRKDSEWDVYSRIGTYSDQVAELKMPREAARLAGDTFHQATIPKERYSVKSKTTRCTMSVAVYTP
jgi:hypothetical protein